jgi:hypothetical protein
MPQTQVVEKHETRFIFSNFILNRAVYEIMWKNVVQRGRPQMTIRRMRIAYWIPKATHRLCDTHCFSTATMVARTRLNFTVYVLCLSVL